MSKIDIENILDVIESVLKEKLNDKIASIEAEKTAQGKALSPTLAPIAAKAYYRQDFAAKIWNSKVSVFYGIQSVSPNDSGGVAVAKTYSIFIEILLVDDGQRSDAAQRVTRYGRALEEVAKENLRNVNGAGAVKITECVPAAFLNNLNTSEEMKISGIILTISLV